MDIRVYKASLLELFTLTPAVLDVEDIFLRNQNFSVKVADRF